MKTKLSVFRKFVDSLYPHESEYLVMVHNFDKKENIRILDRIYENKISDKPKPFDESIDKRTYSYIKNWIIETLRKIDVDIFFEWLIGVERKVLTDIISPVDEAEILANIKRIEPSHYYFVRFYELLQYYRDYLMVRNRSGYRKIVSEYLGAYKENYLKSARANRQLHLITVNILKKEKFDENDPDSAENLLRNIYFDHQLDGYTRYRAVVRLTICFYNNRQFEKQAEVYKYLDEEFKTPVFYSKRLLANYYANRAMMHSKLNELPLAEKYGYLSIRSKNSDYLFYLVNLCGVLLKQGKKEEAYKLMQNSIPQLKDTNNNYYKIGFVSFYVRTLLENGKYENAAEYAGGYFDAYKKEIFEHRWHLFFCAYLQALTLAGKYPQVLSLGRRYKLVAKEKQRIDRADYLPVILFYSTVAEYHENVVTGEKLISILVKSASDLSKDRYRSRKVSEILNELSKKIPHEIKEVKRRLRSDSK